jgi:hypothetical protein
MVENINTTPLGFQEVNLNVNGYQKSFILDTLVLTSNIYCFTALNLNEYFKTEEITFSPTPQPNILGFIF